MYSVEWFTADLVSIKWLTVIEATKIPTSVNLKEKKIKNKSINCGSVLSNITIELTS